MNYDVTQELTTCVCSLVTGHWSPLSLHGGSDKQPVFIAVGQTSDFFPLLSWKMIPSGRPMLSYTVNMKMRQKMAQGLLFIMLND